MGIIDQSVVYAFFYALPMVFILLYFLPFYRGLYWDEKIRIPVFKGIILVLLMVYLSLSGSLVPAVVLLTCSLILLKLFLKSCRETELKPLAGRLVHGVKKMPDSVLYFFIGFMVLCLYSLYIGRNDSMNASHLVPLLERYSRLPTGLWKPWQDQAKTPSSWILTVRSWNGIFLPILRSPN